MKKKGLIISTIVMVVVLVASLTTATYAWFTNSGAAEVEDIKFAVSAASDLVIGVHKNNTFDTGTPAWSDFRYDNTTYTPTAMEQGAWAGSNGLGLSVNTRLDLSNMTKAVYSFDSVNLNGKIYTEDNPKNLVAGHFVKTGENTYVELTAENLATYASEEKSYTGTDAVTGSQTAYTKGSGQAVTTGLVRAEDADERILKASGSGDTVSEGTLAAAVKNTDYLDVVFGVAASSNDVKAFGCYIYIQNDQTISSLGMNAAIHVIYSINGSSYTELDLYGDYGSGDANTDVTEPTQPTVTVGSKVCKLIDDDAWAAREAAKGDVALYIPLENKGDSGFAATGAAGIKQIHLIIYICGRDSDCITAATGTGATISVEFLDVNKAAYDAGV